MYLLKRTNNCNTISQMTLRLSREVACFFYNRHSERVLRATAVANVTAIILICIGLFFTEAEAQFAGRFSLSVAEEFNDNIFFSKQREHDFITNITPTFTLVYQPQGSSLRPLTLDISPTGQIFARNPEQNNFGDGVTINGAYTFPYSPRLTFDVADTFQTIGRTQTGNPLNETVRTPTTPGSPGIPISGQNLAGFIPNGRTLDNQFSVSGTYLYAPDVIVRGAYTNGVVNYLDEGGTDLSNSMGIRASYRWRQEHNLFVGYTLKILQPRQRGGRVTRNNDEGIVHDFQFGDDYFSNTQIQLTPTLTLALSTGISLNTSTDGPLIVNNTTVQLTKLWEKATLTAGVFKGLTNSFGVSGISDTIDLVSAFNIRLTERLSAHAGVDYSIFNTDDVNFKPFRAYGGLLYGVTSWLCSGVRYTHRRLSSGAGGQNTVLQTQGNVYGNSLFVMLSAHFNSWPTLGLARGQACGHGGAPRAPQLPERSSAPRL